MNNLVRKASKEVALAVMEIKIVQGERKTTLKYIFFDLACKTPINLNGKSVYRFAVTFLMLWGLSSDNLRALWEVKTLAGYFPLENKCQEGSCLIMEGIHPRGQFGAFHVLQLNFFDY